MKENKEENQQKGFGNNPEKSFDAGRKGGKDATPVANQSSGVNNPNTGASKSLGDTHSRIDRQNKPVQGQSQQHDTTERDTTGKKNTTGT